LEKKSGTSSAQVAKRHGVSEQTIYGWRQRFSGMNEVRPHSSLGKMMPMAFAQMVGNNPNTGATLKN